MKSHSTTLCPILLCGLSCLLVNGFLSAQAPTPPRSIDTPYVYPVKPGTKEWRDLPSTFARKLACQVPQSVVESLTTRALLETYLIYPFLNVPLISANPISALEGVAKDFNVAKELFQRENLVKELARYLSQIPSRVRVPSKKLTSMEEADLQICLSSIQLIARFKDFRSTASPEDRKLLLKVSWRAFEALTQCDMEDDSFSVFLIANNFRENPNEDVETPMTVAQRTLRFKELLRRFGD